MIRIESIENGRFQGNEELCAQLIQLASPCYIDPEPLVRDAFQHCDQLDLGYVNEVLVAFFLTRNMRFTNWCGTYLNVLVSSPNRRGDLVLERVLTHRASQTNMWLRTQDKNGWYFGTTANPLILRALPRYATSINPHSSNIYTQDELSKLADIQQSGIISRWTDLTFQDHPFVLRGVSAVRYSEAENSRVSARRMQGDLFDELQVDESTGDRVLFLARVCPSPQRVRHSNAMVSA